MTATNPFPGLRPFKSGETHLFFGRDGQSEELIRRLGRTRFLAVVGTSGSGKSSLVCAGLLPALQGGLMASAGSDWRIASFRPGHDPVGNLARALTAPEVFGSEEAREAEMQAALTEATLRRSGLGLLEVVRQARGASGPGGRPRLQPYENLLVVVDQFEELFRFRQLIEVENSKEDAAAFVRLLLEAGSRPEEKIYVVLTMRSDFLGDCAQFQGLPEAINDGQYLIPRMTRDERREAVTGPVAVGGGRITDPLVNQLLNDMGDNPDQLPILQHALMRTWDYWLTHRRNGEPIDLPHYHAVGGMGEALSRHAEEAYGELGEAGQEQSARQRIAEKLFKALTEKGADNREIRRPVELCEAAAITEASEGEVAAVVEVFRRPGRSFLMPPAGVPLDSDSLIDISHESLIRNWERLKKWTDEEAQSARIYRRLAETAVLHRAGEEALLKDPALQVALDWREKSRPNAVWARRYHPEFETATSFLDASVAAREAERKELEKQRRRDVSYKRTRLAALFLALSFLLAAAASVYAYNQSVLAVRSRDQAFDALSRAEVAKEEADIALGEARQRKAMAEAQAVRAQEAMEEALRQKAEAEALKAEADRRAAAAGEREMQANAAFRKAEVARREAEEKKQEAEAQSARNALAAEKNAKEAEDTRQVLYPAAMNLAQQAYEANDFERGREMLNLQTSFIRNTPGFEWFYLWHLLNGEKESLDIPGGTYGLPVAVSDDGRLLAAGAGQTVKLHALGGDARPDFDLTIPEEKFQVAALALSPDGRLLAVGNSEGDASGVKLFDVATRREVATLKGDGWGTEGVFFMPDGKRLVKTGRRGVWLWDFASAGEPTPLVPDKRDINEFVASLSPDGKLLATRFHPFPRAHQPPPPDSPLLLWDVATRTKVGELPTNARLAAFSRDGRLLATSTGYDGAVSLWDVTTRRELFNVRTQTGLSSLALSPDAKLIAAGYFDGTLKLLSVGEDSATPLMTLSGHGREVAPLRFTPDGRLLVSGGRDGTVKTWDIAALVAELTPLPISSTPFTLLSHSPDGRSLAVGGSIVRPPAAGAPGAAERLEEQDEAGVSSAFSPDGRLLALGTTRRLRLFDAATRQQLGQPLLEGGEVLSVSFSRDGRLLAAGNTSGVVTVWDTSAPGFKKVAELKDSIEGMVEGLAFSNDGKRVAVRVHSIVSLWDVAKAEMLAQLPTYEGASPVAMACSPTQPVLALGLSDGKVLLVDDERLNPIAAVRGHKSSVKALAFTPDGRRIASGDFEGFVKLRDAATLREALTLRLTSYVQSVAFSPDGRMLATLDGSSNVRFWRAAADAEVEAKAQAESK
ncbi:MAG TPA: LpqB family beta-propeller domain-containing protein [Pyrinomonadaceae bacterium]|nr:LpqB family beta-propeller domain-containing protein [Pyrinomonadaceae bacterium]